MAGPPSIGLLSRSRSPSWLPHFLPDPVVLQALRRYNMSDLAEMVATRFLKAVEMVPRTAVLRFFFFAPIHLLLSGVCQPRQACGEGTGSLLSVPLTDCPQQYNVVTIGAGESVSLYRGGFL